MKRFVHILSFLTLGLASCTGCTKKDNAPPACTGSDCNPVKPVPTTDAGVPPVVLDTSTSGPNTDILNAPDQKFSGPDWEFSAPEGWSVLEVEDTDVVPEILLVNPDEHNLVILVKDVLPPNTSTAEYALTVIRGLHEDGATVSSTNQVELNDKKFILVDTSKDGARLWFWIAAQNGTGYALSCGGPANEDHHEEICNDVAKSLILK